MSNRYRIFCLESETDNLPDGVEVEATYPAFVVARIEDGDLDAVKALYPASPLAAASPAPTPVAPAAAVNAAQRWPERGPYTVTVRFDRPVAAEAEGYLEQAGAELVRAIGSRTWIVRCPNKEVLGRLEDLPNLERMQLFVPTVRVTPAFFAQAPVADGELLKLVRAMGVGEAPLAAAPGVMPGLLSARFLGTDERDQALRSLRRAGIQQVSRVGERMLSIDLTTHEDRAGAVEAIVTLDGLEHVEEKRLPRYFNNVAREIVGRGVLDAAPDGLGLDGSGEIVAVADSGLDTGDATTIHPDFRGRIRDIRSFPIGPSLASLLNNPGGDDGASDRFSGHGTHVTGSVLGDGSRSVALGLQPIQGTAPGAELVFQAIDQSVDWNVQGLIFWFQRGRQPPANGLFGIPDDLSELLQPAFDQGARIHSDSWGGGVPGEYDDQCRQVDEFTWNNRDFLVVVAAGNDGGDTPASGPGIDPGSVSSPAVAKNCLTVGASENLRPDQAATYGSFFGPSFPRAPFADDPMADDADDVVAFSSRGPCNTGRRKPDVLAPGTWVLSTRSSQVASTNFGWGPFAPARDDYMFMGGTSMATPLVSGCAAVVRQYLRTEEGMDAPSAALVKAALIHSCEYLDYRFAAPDSAPFADNEQGFGRVHLARLLRPENGERVRFLDHRDELAEGAMAEFEVEVTDDAAPLRATLVYTDFPGEDLVHDLDLFAFAPGGGVHIGNDFNGSGTPDNLNNVERVHVESPAVGTWRFRVVASAVPMGGQDFALVISGITGEE